MSTISLAEASRRMDVSVDTLRKRIYDGTLQSTKINGRHHIDENEINNFNPYRPARKSSRQWLVYAGPHNKEFIVGANGARHAENKVRKYGYKRVVAVGEI